MKMTRSEVVVVLVTVLLACVCQGVLADEGGDVPAPPSDVLDLNAANFESTLKDLPLVAVEFFSPWCGHCKSLAPEWEKAATAMKGKVPLAKVDCTANQELCNKNEVQGYPTLKLFRSGESSPLEVARKAEAIVSYLTKELEPAVTKLSTEEEVKTFLETHPLTVIAFLDNDHDDRWAAFNKVAQAKRHTLSFVVVLNGAWAGYSTPTIELRRNFEEPKVVYTGEFDSTAITQWVSRNLLPVLGEINGDTFMSYMAAELPIGYLFVDPNAETTAPLLADLAPKLAPFRNDFAIAWINNNRYAQQAQRLGLSTKIPSLALDNHLQGVRYVFPEDQTITADALGEWFGKYKAGELKPFVKSEDIPEKNDAPVKVVVAHSFNTIVNDASKDVLLEFYAPWCGHCKNLAPIYDQLGSLFTSVPSVVIAKIDATANDVSPKLNIRGFPTILFFPANQKDTPIEYQGARTLDELAKFVHSHASTKFEFPTVPESQGEHDHPHDEL